MTNYPKISLALFEPDIPQNTGSLIRLCACLGVNLHIIEPCGFVLDSRELKRVAMDYGAQVSLTRHVSWSKFLEDKEKNRISRLVLLSTKSEKIYTDFEFKACDCLLLGRESSGVPTNVVGATDAQVKIAMHGNARSLNVALAAAMVLGEAIRATANP
jgi:tRNA (cytidine/uridine-2'-O-)-methyltransferase